MTDKATGGNGAKPLLINVGPENIHATLQFESKKKPEYRFSRGVEIYGIRTPVKPYLYG